MAISDVQRVFKHLCMESIEPSFCHRDKEIQIDNTAQKGTKLFSKQEKVHNCLERKVTLEN